MVKENGFYAGPNEKDFISKEELEDKGRIQVFPDKKERKLEFEEVSDYLMKGREIMEGFSIGQKEAKWRSYGEYPQLPIMIYLMTDVHYGSFNSDVARFKEHMDIVENTPNFFVVGNGDDVDNFNATLGRMASGMYENPLPPQIQGRSLVQRISKLERKGKVGVMSFGNHNDFCKGAGQDWYDTFLGQMDCPIFNTGGLLRIEVNGGQKYDLAMTHRYWGTSKLNPTNACKRFMEHEYPEADVIFLGHTHQSEGLHFERGGKDRVAVIGGTFKQEDDWARTKGIGGRPGSPGWVVALWGDGRKMQLFKDVRLARDAMLNSIFALEKSDDWQPAYNEIAKQQEDI